ncbi:MarR family transcriptional regulator [Bartonella sp. HY761]|uniref:MarR family transcriptional regulator n=1 Tax=Bartonella sp. HY761 TaxID=2979330 RepID=UPI002202121B|nr:helix-turn-helix domain-containing protein [Bartonella sp. HY761]UXN07540.1 MarR family transcriptional regulator [Bartonella sp. HY761]
MPGAGTYQIAILGAIGNGLKSMDELAEHLPISRKEISKAASRLVTKSLIERTAIGQFQLSPTGSDLLATGGKITSGPNGPMACLKARNDTFRQRAWSAMRLQKRFTIPSIVTVAKKAKDSDPESNLQRYISNLIKANYVVLLPKREAGTKETSNGFKVFRLIKDTGYLAPIWSKGEMKDRNMMMEDAQ